MPRPGHTDPARGGPRTGVARFIDVIDAAIVVTSRVGINNLTMAAVSAELGVRPQALYHHLPGGRKELAERVASAVVEPLVDQSDRLPIGGDWVENLTDLIIHLLTEVEKYPGLAVYLATTGRNSPPALTAAELMLKQFEVGQLSDDRLVAAYDAVNALLTGWTVIARPTPDAGSSNSSTPLATAMADAAPPALASLRAALDALLRGLASLPAVR